MPLVIGIAVSFGIKNESDAQSVIGLVVFLVVWAVFLLVSCCVSRKGCIEWGDALFIAGPRDIVNYIIYVSTSPAIS